MQFNKHMKTKHHSSRLLVLTGSVCGLLAFATFTAPFLTSHSYAESPRKYLEQARALGRTQTSEPVPKPALRSPDEALAKGLDYLLTQQHRDGGWGQGGGWRQGSQGGGRVEGAQVEDPSDLGNSCVSLMAVVRGTPASEQSARRAAVMKAFDFIYRQVEGADAGSLYVTSVRDTQLQVKIGSYVDTFLTGWVLSELKGRLADDAAEQRRAAALDKVVAKIERNQKADGSFADNKGWAAVLSQGLASKALNGASRSGAKVSKDALDRDQRQNTEGLDLAKKEFRAPAAAEPSSAGVQLYRESAKLGGLREKMKSNVARKSAATKKLADPSAPKPEQQRAEQELREIAADEVAAQTATDAVASKLRDTRYVAGFGNNGGEEFLSYLNLTESMYEKGGKDWNDWRAKMTETVCGAQNADGSWAGNHCITGRNFCTGAALLTLSVERAAAADVRTTSVEITD